MKIKAFAFTLICMMISAFAIGQETPGIQFEKTTHDFGNILKGDKAEFVFRFTNVSEKDVELFRVKASCGCTTPSYTKDPVAKGATGEISVAYNTNRMGPFSKSITVTYDSTQKPVVLYIKGSVSQGGTPDDDIYTQKVGNLAFDVLSEHVGTLDSDKEVSKTFKVKNVGPLPINFRPAEAEMMYEVDLPDATLIPGQKSEITITVKGERFISPGPFSHSIKLITDDREEANKTLTIGGVLNKVYSEEELAQMPNIEFETLEYDAGKVFEGEKVDVAFKFTNTGQEDLVIESVKPSCGCTASAPKDKVIKAGQSSEILATFNSKGRKGVQNKSVTVRTNDPDQPTLVLRLKIEVESDPFHQNSFGPAAKPGSPFNNR